MEYFTSQYLIWAIMLGAIILDEELSISIWFALLLILSGLIFISKSDDIAPRSEGHEPKTRHN